jgi:biopolymer transport protein TolQ
MFTVLTGMNPVILAVLGILVFFSLVSWAIIIQKLVQIGLWKRSNGRFLAWADQQNGAFSPVPDTVAVSAPLASVYREGCSAISDGISLAGFDRRLRKQSQKEQARCSSQVGFLATTASSTPFIGLFGTVWGIMNAFQNIGQAGSTSLAVVAPGISEALVTTAIGLAAAIPALVGYNFVQSKLETLADDLDDFSGELLTWAESRVLTPSERG